METDYVAGLAGRVGRSVAGDGARRVPRDPGVGEVALGLRRPRRQDRRRCRAAATSAYYLAKELHEAGAKLIVTDIDAGAREARRRRVRRAAPSTRDEIYGVKADIFAPCALGGSSTTRRFRSSRSRSSPARANNQLLEERHGDALEERDILYAPDYVANAGGVINVYSELAGWDARARASQGRRDLRHDARRFEIAKTDGIPTYEAADRLAERRLKAVGFDGEDVAAVANAKRGADRTPVPRARGCDELQQPASDWRPLSAGRGAARCRSGHRAAHRSRRSIASTTASSSSRARTSCRPRCCEAMGSPLTNKYAEGLAGQALLRRLRVRRPGRAARDRSREAALRRRPRERAAALRRAGECRGVSRVPQAGRHVPRLDLSQGGHLTHGSPVNFSGLLYKAMSLRRERRRLHRLRRDAARSRASSGRR